MTKLSLSFTTIIGLFALPSAISCKPPQPTKVELLTATLGKSLAQVLHCTPRVYMGCPTLAGPGFAKVTCQDWKEAEKSDRTAWVRWSAGAFPPAVSANTVVVGIEHNLLVTKNVDEIRAHFNRTVQAIETRGCQMIERRVDEYQLLLFARCKDVEVEVRAWLPGTGPSPGVYLSVAPAEVFDCQWAGSHNGTGARPRG